MKDVVESLTHFAIPHLTDNGKPSAFQGKYGKMVLIWQRLQNKESVKPTELKLLLDNFAYPVERGNLEPHLHRSWRDVISDPWWSTVAYFESLEFKYKKSLLEIYNECQIHLSTIHGAKGREAERVILINGMGNITAAGYAQNPDGEIRVFYVGITRAKSHLDIVLGNNPVDFLL
jgi:superfamily I DNA/RNA helicase